MKKILLFLSMMVLTISVNAQLKVNSDGKVRLGTLTQNDRAFVSAGTNFNYSYDSNYGFGLHAKNNTGQYCIGLKGTSSPSSTSSYAIGIQGIAAGGASGRLYGVIGGVNENYKNGAGIFGTLLNHIGVNITGRYAGYFDGAVKITGTLTTSQVLTSSDMRLKENVTYLSDEKGNSALANVLDMNVIRYNYIDAPKPDTLGTASVKGETSKEKEMHYGLSAQELQTMYPDLVREGQDGYLGVNYIELVPILIRSIQELKQELDEVKGTNVDAAMSRGATTAIETASTKTGNVLYQNTPNPFKEQTIIRFSLADDVTSASICIFDMTGKMLKKLPISSGETSVSINGWELGEGMFLYTLIVNGKEIDTKRMIITK